MEKETLIGRYKIKACDTCGSVEFNCCDCEDKRNYYSQEYVEKLLRRTFNEARRTYYSGFSQMDVYEHDKFENCLNELNIYLGYKEK